MKQLSYFLAGALLFLGLVGVAAYQVPAVQDVLFSFGLKTQMGQAGPEPNGMKVVICGSASPLGNDLNRAQACVAVLTPEHLMLFDTGARSPLRINQARLPLGRLNAVFLTHFHSDHITGLPDVNLASWAQGRRNSLRVYGPEGIHTVVYGFNAAYRLDQGYRVAHHGNELFPAEAGPMTPKTFHPGDVVWQDDLLTVRSFPVEHPPIRPAVGYRIDYKGRSVVISGDSNASDHLFKAAEGADLLLHDALSRNLLDLYINNARELEFNSIAAIMSDTIDYHADTKSLPAKAAQAEIGMLAYYHLVPVPPNALAEKIFRRGLPGEVILVRDLHTFVLPDNSTDIIIQDP